MGKGNYTKHGDVKNMADLSHLLPQPQFVLICSIVGTSLLSLLYHNTKNKSSASTRYYWRSLDFSHLMIVAILVMLLCWVISSGYIALLFGSIEPSITFERNLWTLVFISSTFAVVSASHYFYLCIAEPVI